MLFLWFKFILIALVIIFSGYKVTRYGSLIAETTGIGGLWIGTIILASVTSLPEVVTTISSVILVKESDLALGNVLGSNLFNLFIIVYLDFLYKKRSLLGEVKERHILSLGLGMLLVSIITFSLMSNLLINIHKSKFSLPSIYHIGLDSFLLAFIYIIGTRLIFKFENKHSIENIAKSSNNNLFKNIIIFSIFSLIIIISSITLTKLADKIAIITNLGHTLVGSIFLAISTSLPEIVVSISAVKIGEIDIGLGNILGSNIFNMTIVFLADIFFFEGSILSLVKSTHILTAIIQIIIYCVVLMSIIYKPKRNVLNLGWDSISILILYILSILTLYNIK